MAYFNSRPCERGDLALFCFLLMSHQFQFTPLREGRLMQEGFDKYLEHIFQFTPLREGRLRQ